MMKKTGFFLTAVLMMTMLVFTSCGSRNDDSGAAPDNQQNSVAEDLEEGAEDVKDGVEDAGDDLKRGASDIGEDIRDGADDAADDMRDAGDADRHRADGTGREADRAENDRDSRSEVQ